LLDSISFPSFLSIILFSFFLYINNYFKRQLENQKRNKELLGDRYFDNDLVVSKPNGVPLNDSKVSSDFARLLKTLNMNHIRFHDLRHTAATNMHELTGDFYTVGEILGHTLKGVGIHLGISTNLDAVTQQYVDVRIERKLSVLNTYHKAVLGPVKRNRFIG
jgi:integrase